MRDIRNIVILTGAGISAESGLETFRAADGLWAGHRVEDVATPEAYARNPALVHQFYDARRARLSEVEPNAAHVALARLDAEWAGELLIVTQNVDDLHERAGATRLLHMHGEVKRGWCLACGERFAWEGPMSPGDEGVSTALDTNGWGESAPPSPFVPNDVEGRFCGAKGVSIPRLCSGEPSLGTNANVCPLCATVGMVRPNIVWFGEMPYEMERIEAALRGADLFVSVGTSGAVYPAAGFVQTARYCGATTLEINLEPSQGSVYFEERRYGRASELVPEWVAEMLDSPPF